MRPQRELSLVLNGVALVPIKLVVRLFIVFQKHLHQQVAQLLIVGGVGEPVAEALAHEWDEGHALFGVGQLLRL